MPKLIYSLVLWPESRTIDETSVDVNKVYFRVHWMDARFRGQTFNAANGWRIRSCSSPEISFVEKCVYLHGSRPRESLENRDAWDTLPPIRIDEARAAISELHQALADWAENFPGFIETRPDGTAISEEVQESLLMAEDSEEQPEDEDVDAPPPVDEYVPNKISI